MDDKEVMAIFKDRALQAAEKRWYKSYRGQKEMWLRLAVQTFKDSQELRAFRAALFSLENRWCEEETETILKGIASRLVDKEEGISGAGEE